MSLPSYGRWDICGRSCCSGRAGRSLALGGPGCLGLPLSHLGDVCGSAEVAHFFAANVSHINPRHQQAHARNTRLSEKAPKRQASYKLNNLAHGLGNFVYTLCLCVSSLRRGHAISEVHKCTSEGIGRPGIALKRNNSLQKEPMPRRPVPLLAQLW